MRIFAELVASSVLLSFILTQIFNATHVTNHFYCTSYDSEYTQITFALLSL